MKAKRIFCLVVILLVGVGLFFLLDRWVFPKETYIQKPFGSFGVRRRHRGPLLRADYRTSGFPKDATDAG